VRNVGYLLKGRILDAAQLTDDRTEYCANGKDDAAPIASRAAGLTRVFRRC
jgi:hypothetical protein